MLYPAVCPRLRAIKRTLRQPDETGTRYTTLLLLRSLLVQQAGAGNLLPVPEAEKIFRNRHTAYRYSKRTAAQRSSAVGRSRAPYHAVRTRLTSQPASKRRRQVHDLFVAFAASEGRAKKLFVV